MKKIFAFFAFIILSFVILGFLGIGIPIGKERVKEIVLGERKNSNGQALEQILKHEGLQNYFFVISFDGPGKKHQSFNEFYLKKGENKIRLSHLPFTPQEYDVLRPVLPVQGSAKWVAVRLCRVDQNDVDVEITIFDEIKICKTLIVKECVRISGSMDSWNDLFNYGMTFKNGNAKIIFQTINGERIFDISKDMFEKK